MVIEQEKTRFVVYDKDGYVLLITSLKSVAAQAHRDYRDGKFSRFTKPSKKPEKKFKKPPKAQENIKNTGELPFDEKEE